MEYTNVVNGAAYSHHSFTMVNKSSNKGSKTMQDVLSGFNEAFGVLYSVGAQFFFYVASITVYVAHLYFIQVLFGGMSNM